MAIVSCLIVASAFKESPKSLNTPLNLLNYTLSLEALPSWHCQISANNVILGPTAV